MITLATFPKMLLNLGFTENEKGVYSKSFPDSLYTVLQVDFNRKKLIYPDKITIGDETTSNFEHPENFVVFECVCALLEKGYRPEHIELEKRWKLGHIEKSGKADICVSDAEGNMLLIIECKTYGSEYVKERKQTIQDGGQLFSYWQQERSTRWLALYASDFQNGELVRSCEVIPSVDDANVVELAKKDDSYRLYKNAHTAAELFEVWDETYSKTFYPDLIFGKDSTAYQIGVRPLRKCDLKEFKAEDKIVNRFEEILRHNNVSDKENAFNRLTALFICKLVDEIGKSDDEELEFQYKQGTDTYESLQDRLQKLHQKGMQDFMRETIFYIANDYPDKLLAQYAKQKRQAMIEDLRKTIRILKFYSNNDFSFKDVHNEELFLQNGKVLVEVVQLFERYRIVYHSKEQFLGDLFEQLLNKGFKQNEGQFFTPMPITRFIWDALPLESVIHNAGKYNLPKVIDFACGAGHFLTEAVEAINAYLESIGQPELKKENAWVEKSIFGIEKDYRLARVSKISLFMNGAGYGNIIFGDGLDNYPDKGIEPGTFDILVANPPYSVSAFKQHFKPKNNSFELIKRITNTGSEIEVLFVERISQLLKPKGLAAVILPASILSNASASYIGARESLLENFKLRAIVQFGSKTFGATGTNTVVLFLEKYDEPPKRKEMVKDSANAIQCGVNLTEWEDQAILTAYLAQIEVSAEDYRQFSQKTQDIEQWKNHAYFGQYVKSFEKLSEITKKKGQKNFKQLSVEQQNEILRNEFYKYVLPCEYEKLRFFALVYNQTTLVVTAPADNDEQKTFLGYDWSNRKGAEGIQILTPGGRLYNDEDRYATNTVAAAVRCGQVTSDQEKYCTINRLQDMIDFSRVEFNKEIKPSSIKKMIIKSRWPIVFLDSHVAEIEKGQSITKAEAKSGNVKVVAGGVDFAYTTDKPNRVAGVITVSASGANAGFVNYWDEEIFASDCSTIIGKDQCLTRYLYYYLNSIQQQIFELAHGSAQPHVYPVDLNKLKLPLPPLDIQRKIVEECEAVDKDCLSLEQAITTLKETFQSEIDPLFSRYPLQSLGALAEVPEYGANESAISGNPATDYRYIRITDIADDGSLNNDWKTAGRIEEKYILQEGDLLFARSGATAGKTFMYRTKYGKAIFAGYLIRFRLKDNFNPEYVNAMLKSTQYSKWAEKTRGGTAQPNINAKQFSAFQIPVPPLAEQKRIVDCFYELDRATAQFKTVFDKATSLKQLILKKYL